MHWSKNGERYSLRFLLPCLILSCWCQTTQSCTQHVCDDTAVLRSRIWAEKDDPETSTSSIMTGEESGTKKFSESETWPGGLGGASWESVANRVLDLTTVDVHEGISFEIVQYEKSGVEFYTLSTSSKRVEVSLLSKGHNYPLSSHHAAVHCSVASLGSKPTIRIGVGSPELLEADWWWCGWATMLGVLWGLSALYALRALKFRKNKSDAAKQRIPGSFNSKAEQLQGSSETLKDCLCQGKARQETTAYGCPSLKRNKELITHLSCEAGWSKDIKNEATRASFQRKTEDCTDVQASCSTVSVQPGQSENRFLAPSCPYGSVTSSLTRKRVTSSGTAHDSLGLQSSQTSEEMDQPYSCPPGPPHPTSFSQTGVYHQHPTSPQRASSTLAARTSSSSSAVPCRCLHRLLLLSLTLAALTAVTVGVSSMKREYRLKVGVPQSTLIRHVRAYSQHPELADLSDNPASLALVSKLQLLDLHGCHGNVSRCPTVAVCDNSDNALLCRCRRGYYFTDHRCKECRKSCPDAHYLVTACSANADAVCTPCTKCTGSQYEAAVCTTTRDTICVDVTFPVGILKMNHSNGGRDEGYPISASHSSNVFLERLVHMKELETPMYVTNNQQTQDFVWHRESGIDIVVGISGVFLIPEYRELDAEDDSLFFSKSSMAEQRTLDLFAKTQQEYCKHPVPDFYYLHLEVIKNRTAAARVVRCDSQDPALPKCPESHKDGDRFLKWDINKACDKFPSGSGPAALRAQYNMVVCTEESSMAREVFQLARPTTMEMKFPSLTCSRHHHHCQACLNNASATCSARGTNKSCCGLSCYRETSCHQYHGPSCPPAEVECAAGEVHVFTLMPMFPSMREEFQCHLTYRRPPHLYNVSYTVSIPALGLTSPPRRYTATAASLRQHRRHADLFHFMQIWHDTRMPFNPDLLLRGNHKQLEKTQDQHNQPFVVHSLKQNREFSKGRGFSTAKNAEFEYSTAVQFERPFLYSSTSWYRHQCRKNMSQIFPNQTLYRNDAMRVMGRKVGKNGEAWYQISHTERSPYIKLSVREGESVLRWLQGTVFKGTVKGEGLTGSLVWDNFMHHWTITISGSVKDCPAVLTVELFNKLMSSCLALFDVVVNCPQHFTLTFNLSRTHSDLPDIFVALVNDSLTSHRLVLSSILSPVSLPASAEPTEEQLQASYRRDLEQWAVIFAILILTFVALMIVFGLYLWIKCRAAKAALDSDHSGANHTETAMLNNQSNSVHAKPADKKARGSGRSRCCLCAFMILYVLYTLFFTFTVTLLILYATHRGLAWEAGGVANFSSHLQRELNASFQSVQRHESREGERLFRSVEDRLRACSAHLQKQNRDFLDQYQRAVSNLLIPVFREEGAIDSLASDSILQNSSVYSQQIEQFLLDCNRTVQSVLDRFNARFAIHIKDAVRNGWLDFPREVFLTQEGHPASEKYSMSANQLARFLHWLQVDKTDQLLAVSSLVADRLAEIQLPSPTEHLKRSVQSPFHHFVSTLPPEPMAASHTFLVLSRPDGDSASPVFHATTTAATTPAPGIPKPHTAFLYSEGPSQKLKFRAGGKEVDSGGFPDEDQDLDSSEEEEYPLVVLIMLGMFVFLDVVLIAFRLSWMVNQVQAAKAGYEDRIPTDPVSQRLLAIQTGYRMTRMQDMYQSYSYSAENRENVTVEERASESEYKTYFCQGYPKSKDDILREIMAQKMNSTEQNLGQDQMAAARQHKPSFKFGELRAIRELCNCCHWLHRMLISHLVWRFALTVLAVLLLCLLAYVADFWLTSGNVRVLVGGQSALRDLYLQVHMTNHHLADLGAHLSSVLDQHASAIHQEVAMSNDLLTSTLQTQRDLLQTLLERVCKGAGTPVCNVSSYSSLPLPALPTWTACNFLPLQPLLYLDVNTVNLDKMVDQQLSPLLESVKHSVFRVCALAVTFLCVMFVCHAGATVARYHMIISGQVSRVQIFQISENTSLMYDGGPNTHKPMQRSASWLESCESGVYLGESELETHTTRDV